MKLLSLSILVALIAIPASAFAQDTVPDNNWRQKDRSPPETHIPMWNFELRFAPYWPAVDGAFSSGKGPYAKTFADPKTGNVSPIFYFGLELDFLPLRIPYLGGFGPGFGWGWTRANAAATVASTGVPSTGEDTSLTIMPMHLSAVLRFDELMRRTGVPIVPFVKVGPAVGLWTASNTLGTSVYGPGCNPTLSDDQIKAMKCVVGKGATWGANVALGAALSLNFLDPHSASMLEHGTDVAHVYLFAEWMNALLTGFGSKKEMHVGTSTIVAGLSADF